MTLRNIVGAAIAAAGIAAVPCAARAAPGYVAQAVNLRAGPGVDYPLVAQLPAGTPIEIYGCLSGWTWCDIAVNGERGWAAGVTLQVVYENQPALLPQYGGAIGLPFIGFDVGNYWGSNYRGRPWYGTEDRWRGHPYGGPEAFGGPGPRFGGGDFHGQPGRPGFAPGGPGPGRGPVQPGAYQHGQPGPRGPQPNENHPQPGRPPPGGHDGHPDDHGPR